jgi:hypothetical protein
MKGIPMPIEQSAGFLAGNNTLEFLIENRMESQFIINSMDFCADLKGKANRW